MVSSAYENVTIKVHRLNTDIRSVQSPLEARPEVLDPVSVDVIADIALDVVNDLVIVRRGNKWIGSMFIGDDVRSYLYIAFQDGLHICLLAVCDHASANLAAPSSIPIMMVLPLPAE